MFLVFFFFNDTATTEIYTLSLHDALPIYRPTNLLGELPTEFPAGKGSDALIRRIRARLVFYKGADRGRSEEHTSELQSRQYLVCRLLLEKKKKNKKYTKTYLYISYKSVML